MTGQVHITARCLLPEKLIQRALDAGIRFIAVTPGDRCLHVVLRPRDEGPFIALCRRFSIPAKVTARRGGSAAARWLRRRWTVLVGLVAGLAACGLMLSRLWVVDIAFTGDAAASGDAAALRAILNEMDIRPGISRDIDTAALSGELLTRCESLSYVGARVEGVRLTIEAAPEVGAPEVYDLEVPRNLYADRSGIVVWVDPEAGTPCVKPGDAVRRGQLLILGEERVAREATRPIAALGRVMVRAWVEGSAEGRTTEVRAHFTGRQSASAALATPWLEIPLSEGERFEREARYTERMPIGGLYVPLSLNRVTRREVRLIPQEGDRALLTRRLAALALADARAALALDGPDQYEITRCWVRFTRPDEDTLRACAVCEILTDAATPGEAPPQGG